MTRKRKNEEHKEFLSNLLRTIIDKELAEQILSAWAATKKQMGD